MALDDIDDDNPYRSPETDRHVAAAGNPAVEGGDAVEGARHVMEPLTRASGWITFAGVLLIIYGASMIIILVGIVPLWVGILMVQAQTRIKEGHRTGDLERMREGNEMLRKAAKVWGIFTIVAVGGTFLIYGLVIVAVVVGAASGSLR